jgi:hypothetical protein
VRHEDTSEDDTQLPDMMVRKIGAGSRLPLFVSSEEVMLYSLMSDTIPMYIASFLGGVL